MKAAWIVLILLVFIAIIVVCMIALKKGSAAEGGENAHSQGPYMSLPMNYATHIWAKENK